MRITVTLTQKEIIAAIHDYLHKVGVPSTYPDDAVRIYFNGVLVPIGDTLEARASFDGVNYTTGPFR